MHQLIVRNLEEEVFRELKSRAARNGRSAEAEHREILREVLLEKPKRSLKELLHAMPAAKRQETSKTLRELITEGRRLGELPARRAPAHFGPRSEKLAAFRMLPFRGFKTEKPEEPAALPAPEPQIP